MNVREIVNLSNVAFPNPPEIAAELTTHLFSSSVKIVYLLFFLKSVMTIPVYLLVCTIYLSK